MADVVNGTGNDVHISAEAVPAGPRVYFIREGDAIKIGFSENVKVRFAGLQSGHHGSLELLGTIAAPVDIEQAILAKFDHLRIRGEWFRAEPELLEFIKSGGRDLCCLPPVGAVTVKDFAEISKVFGRWHKKRLKIFSTPMLSASTNLGFWLQQLQNGITEPRVNNLQDAYKRFMHFRDREQAI